MSRRRLFALVAAFAVALGALWPLVSAAKPRSPQIPVFLCTQSGFQHPGAPADAGDDFHCPLCIATAEAVTPAIATVHAAPPMHALDPAPQASTPHRIFFAQPPPSRGPPSLS